MAGYNDADSATIEVFIPSTHAVQTGHDMENSCFFGRNRPLELMQSDTADGDLLLSSSRDTDRNFGSES